jgi:hypothetical protein
MTARYLISRPARMEFGSVQAALAPPRASVIRVLWNEPAGANSSTAEGHPGGASPPEFLRCCRLHIRRSVQARADARGIEYVYSACAYLPLLGLLTALLPDPPSKSGLPKKSAPLADTLVGNA